jgi:FkbM family methyltransferase
MFKRAVQKVFSALGYKVLAKKNLPPVWGLAHFFTLLKGFGFAPKRIWDVGANRGDWTRAAIQYFPEAEYTLLEPQDNLKNSIQDLIDSGHKIRWIHAGAGARPGRLPFYVVGPKNEGSTFLDLPRVAESTVQRIEVPVRTLNEVLATLGSPVPEMLKIDAEGLDLQVLEGATDLLGRTEIVLAEAAIGQLDLENTAGALIQAMDGYGYRLIDISDLNRSPAHGVLWLCEFAFLLKSSRLLERAADYLADSGPATEIRSATTK